MTLMATETRTEYAIKGTVGRHGKWQVAIVPSPDHKTDRKWNEEQVAELRERQANVGLTPDAELVTRTVTVGDWHSEDAEPTVSGGICRDHFPQAKDGCEACATATPPAFRKGDPVTYENAPHVVAHVFSGRDSYELIPGDDPAAIVRYAERCYASADQLTAR